MRRVFLACALLIGVAACGTDAGGGASEWKAVAAATGTARAERIAAVLREFDGALGEWLDRGRRADAEFAATEGAAKAAAELLDAYRPGGPDPALTVVADRAQRWPRNVRAAALRALARLHEPSAARLLAGRAWTLDAAEEDTATAWIALAEALAPAGDAETRRKMRDALEAVAGQRALDGDAAGAARSRALAARLAAVDDPARAPGAKDVEALRAALIAGAPDERAAAAAALARVGTEEARSLIDARADAERDPFVAHQLRRLAARGGASGAGSGPGPAAAFAAWSARHEEALADASEAGTRALAASEAKAKELLARWAPEVRDLRPADRLAVARLADAARDGAALRRALATLSGDRGEEGRIATTWIASLALEDHDPAGALVFLRRLEKDFEGRGLDAQGRAVSAEILAGAIVEEAAAVARRAVEGPVPDPAAATRALAAGREARASAREDEEAADRLEAARAWVELDAAGLAAVLPAGKGPRIVVFADHYQLLEPVLPSVLERWARGVDVVVVGILEGRVRHGIRRGAAKPAEERAAIEAAAKAVGVPVVRFVGGVGADLPRPAWLDDVPAALLILDQTGTPIARASGAGLDPRPLEPAVAPLSRDPKATAPPR
jgi:hypothetical protein